MSRRFVPARIGAWLVRGFAAAVLIAPGLVAPLRGEEGDVREAELYWPQWRGPLGTGEAPHADPPSTWSETENVRWRIDLPGRGHSTPVVWEDFVFVTSAVPYGEELEPRRSGAPGAHDNVPVRRRHAFVVTAVRRRDGEILWKSTVKRALPHEGGHYTGSQASNSPATDGEAVYAYFGSRGVYALDYEGELLWKKDLGKLRTKHGHGEGSSPALYGDTLVINRDHEGESSIVALETESGDVVWQKARDEVTSWASPVVVVHEGRPQAIVSGSDRIRGYDLATGEVLWACGGLSDNVVASPVAGDGMVVAASSYDTRAMLAIRLDGAEGDITGSDHVVWSRRRRTPYVPSPLLYRGSVYFLSHYQNILSRVDVATGEEEHGPFRLQGLRNIYASPVAAAGRVYVTDRTGATMVIRHDEPPALLGMNRLASPISASAALVEGDIILRGESVLYAIGEDGGGGGGAVDAGSGDDAGTGEEGAGGVEGDDGRAGEPAEEGEDGEGGDTGSDA